MARKQVAELDQFEFFADDMGYGKFKNWCVNGVKPN